MQPTEPISIDSQNRISIVYALQRRNVACKQSASFPFATSSQSAWGKATQFSELWHMFWVYIQAVSSMVLCGTYSGMMSCSHSFIYFIQRQQNSSSSPRGESRCPWQSKLSAQTHQFLYDFLHLRAESASSAGGLLVQALLPDSTCQNPEPTFNDAASVTIVTSVIFLSLATDLGGRYLSLLSFHTYHSLAHCIATCHSK